jgi:hypothetical protein
LRLRRHTSSFRFQFTRRVQEIRGEENGKKLGK